MTSQLNTNISAQVQALLHSLGQMLGVDLDFDRSKEWKLVLESRDGRSLSVVGTPLDLGSSFVYHGIEPSDLVVPAQGALDTDSSSGTATLVGSTVTVTVSVPEGGTPVPAGSTVYATVTTPGGVPKKLAAVRASDTTITISSDGDGYGAVLDSAGVTGTLVAGEKADIALANTAGDLLAVKEVTPGGGAADHFSVVRVNDTTVKVQAHDAAGALVATNTSVVKVYNFGAKGHETSTVRWTVVRP